MEYKIFGCKTNKYFTEKWINTEYLANKKGVFIASCIVTDKAKSKWIKFIKNSLASFKGNDEKIYLSGCATIKKGELTNDFYNIYPELIKYQDKIVLLGEDPSRYKFKEIAEKIKKISLYTRKYIIIQNGCDNYCTFCLTIQARGKHFSRNIEDIINEINSSDSKQVNEIVITGTNIGAWGSSNTKIFYSSKLNILLQEILDKTNIKRIRLSSIGIEYLSDELLKLFENKRIYPHFHLSIQSGSDKILKLMNRNYSKKILLEKLEKIRNIKREDSINISIGADFIVGFPDESEDDFEDTLNIIKKYNINKVHFFPFSKHNKSDFIPASLFPNQINDKIKKERLKKINEISSKIREDFLIKNSGKKLNILIEKINGEKFGGWSENYIGLNENNFEIDGNPELIIGEIYSGTYQYNPLIKEKFEEN